MTRRTYIPLVGALAAVAGLAPTSAQAGPPLETRATAAAAVADGRDAVCTIKARRSYSLAEARRGMPVHVTCDRSTAVFADVNIAANDPASRFIDYKAHPYTHGWSRPRTIEAGTPSRFRVRLQPFAARAVERAGDAKVYFGLGIKQSDGRYHNNPKAGGYVGSWVKSRGAGASAARAATYKGKTDGGGSISFRLSGNRVSGVNGAVPTVCLESMGSYQSRAGVELFQPPGSFPLGRTAQVKALQPAAMNQGIKATKTYTFSAKQARSGRVKGRLRVSFSFLRPGPSIYQSYIYLCSSSVSFSAKEAS
jgi:hypothetical protein